MARRSDPVLAAMIEAIDLSKRYPNGVLALEALNLRIAAGEVGCLLGTNNSGKTTAINLFLAFDTPTAGKALIDGVEVARDPQAARRNAGFLNDRAAFYPRLSARQNLRFLASLAGGRHRREEIDMAMREVGLPERCFEQRTRELTPGMRQRLGLAAALLKDSPALFLDEPVAALDLKEAAELAELVRQFQERGKAILISTRDIFWARQLADWVTILQDGRTVLTCARDEVRYENLEQIYLSFMRGGYVPDGQR